MRIFYVEEHLHCFKIDNINQTNEIIELIIEGVVKFNRGTVLEYQFILSHDDYRTFTRDEIPFPFTLAFEIKQILKDEIILDYYLEFDEIFKDEVLLWKLSQ